MVTNHPKSRKPMARLYKRVIQDPDLGRVEQFLRPDPKTGTMVGWEVYENGTKSQEAPAGRILPIGYYET